MAKKDSGVSGIVLLDKQPGLTSFSSLFAVKKALGTSKVGHTGTLDSFAEGLLVVCAGNATRLSSHITAFDKTYEAVIEFGKETDTLDPTGKTVKTASLPALKTLSNALEQFRGETEQLPPEYSALKVNGKRASTLARNGCPVELKKRTVFVYACRICEVLFSDGTALCFPAGKTDDSENNFAGECGDKAVWFARIQFEVSKGTYIRSLARDIGNSCGSCAYVAGLLRTKVGGFDVKDAVSAGEERCFSISTVRGRLDSEKNSEKESESGTDISEEIRRKIQPITPAVAEWCGLPPVFVKSGYENHFLNGRHLTADVFSNTERTFSGVEKYAVFSEGNAFFGVVSFLKNSFHYEYVIPQNLQKL